VAALKGKIALVTDVRLMLIPDSGHGSHFQFPEEFAEAVARFHAALLWRSGCIPF